MPIVNAKTKKRTIPIFDNLVDLNGKLNIELV